MDGEKVVTTNGVFATFVTVVSCSKEALLATELFLRASENVPF